MSLSSAYQHVDPDFYDQIEIARLKTEVKIVYFMDTLELNDAIGKIDTIVEEDFVQYLKLYSGDKVRLDRIITLNGKPGPQYEYYSSFGSCSC